VFLLEKWFSPPSPSSVTWCGRPPCPPPLSPTGRIMASGERLLRYVQCYCWSTRIFLCI
jgi:hypothetical protein